MIRAKPTVIYERRVSFNPLTTARANKLARNFLAINCQLLELENCLNPYGFSKSSSQNRKTQFLVSVGDFLDVTSQKGHVLEILAIFGRS